jgi:hypothetical protein
MSMKFTAAWQKLRRLQRSKELMAAKEYDVIVIGAGSTEGGLWAVIIEADLVGGECSYWACMPPGVGREPTIWALRPSDSSPDPGRRWMTACA